MLMFLLQIALYGAGAALIAYLVYALFLSKSAVAGVEQKKHRRLERRQTELGPRRQDEGQGPPESSERRYDKRRSDD